MLVKKEKRPFRFADGDVEILTYIYQLRFATNDHLIALTGRIQRRLNYRLEKLSKNKYLYRRRNSNYDKYIYTLNKKAAPLLVEQGVATPEILKLRVRLGELKELFLKHALMLSDIHTTLLLASRNSPIKLVDWREGKTDVYDSVTVMEKGERVKYPVRPDAFFTLHNTRRKEGENRSHFFLEADRSTTIHERFQRKIIGYDHYYQQGKHTKKYGIQGFQVVTLTLTEARALNLCKASGDVLPKGEGQFYLFAPVKYFTFENPEHIFDDILVSPHALKIVQEDGREKIIPTKFYSFFPPLAK